MKPKKSLGQNFLKDQEVLDKIIQAADLRVGDRVIEVGPGEGFLTKELIEKARKVIAIEKDDNLVLGLDSRFRGNDKFKIIHGDILEINLPEVVEENNFYDYKVIANIPYYITSAIIKLFLETKYPPKEMILMVQKEVAERIIANPGQMSILAVSIQYYAEPELLFQVDKESFYPVPEVDSAVIRIKIRKENYRERIQEKDKFFKIVRAGFSSKRKTLLNNLSSSLNLLKEEATEKIKTAGLNPTVRAQELSVSDWERLTEIL